MILAHFKRHVRAPETMEIVNMKRYVKLTDGTANFEEGFESNGSINRTDFLIKISSVTRDVQQLLSLVKYRG